MNNPTIITLNSSTMYNITIIGLSIRYTRQIDRKFYTVELHCESSDEVLSKLSTLSSMDDKNFKLVQLLSNSIKDTIDVED